MWLNVKNLLIYCLFLRTAPHHFEAKIADCTVEVLPMIRFGATGLRSCRIRYCLCLLSNWRARMEGEMCALMPSPRPSPTGRGRKPAQGS
ncbi:hypothetical protein F0Q32_19430 [Pseudocitrobacter sp. 73]|nr:hypothetical protein F0Q32_19430 [Pseudocitrobacter sp. 73]